MVCTRLARRLHEPGRGARGPRDSARLHRPPSARSAPRPAGLALCPDGTEKSGKGVSAPRLGAGTAGVCAQCRVQVAWDSRSPQRPAAAGARSPVSLNLPARAAPLSGPHFGGAGTLPRALGEPPGGWRARRSHVKRAGDRRTLGQAGAALAVPAGLGGRGRVCIYVQCLGLCARCARGAHTCAHGPGAPWTCPFHSWSKQKRWSPLDNQTGVTREASLSSQRKRAWRVYTGRPSRLC